MTIENLKKQLILALLIFNFSFWLYIASKEKAGHFLVELSLHPGTVKYTRKFSSGMSLHPGTVQLHQEMFQWNELTAWNSAVTPGNFPVE
jgi:hypothetical protein